MSQSQRAAGTAMPRLADRLIRNSILRVLNLIAAVIVSFFMMPFMIRSMGDRWYGLWVLVGTFVGYYALLDLGLLSAIQRYISRALANEDHREVNYIFNTSLTLFAGAGAASALASVVVALFGSHFIHDPADLHVFRTVMIVCGLSLGLSFPLRAFQGFLGANLRYDFIMSVGLGEMAIRSLLIVYFFRRGHGIVTLAVISLLTSLLANAATVLFVRRRFPAVTIGFAFFNRGKIRQLFGYSVFSFLSEIANQLRFQIDNLIITAFLGLTFVTHYQIGSRVSYYYLIIVIRAMLLTVPVFSALEGQSNFEKIREKFLFVSKLNAMLAVYLAGSILIYGKAFMLRWMGPQYLDSYRVLIILIAGTFFNALQITSTSLVFSLSKHKAYSVVQLGEGVANVVLSIILVRRYGIYGVALGTIIPMAVVYGFFLPIYANRVINVPVWRYVRIMLGACLLGAVVHVASWLVVRRFLVESYERILTLAAATSIVYIAVNAFVLLDRTERRYFKIPL
jgi:O-antigen/teichoic acid export membrane protein